MTEQQLRQKVADIMLHGNQARTGSSFNGLWKCDFAEAESFPQGNSSASIHPKG